MSTIAISAQARRSLAAYEMISDQIDAVQMRLSTGKASKARMSTRPPCSHRQRVDRRRQ
jgi:hypothetical protein